MQKDDHVSFSAYALKRGAIQLLVGFGRKNSYSHEDDIINGTKGTCAVYMINKTY